jgi:hypothetical protein
MAYKVFLITGFALDIRAFGALNLPSESFQLVDFIPIEPHDTLETYALRLGRSIAFSPQDMIGGISLGGMLALEIAKAQGARKIVLIASCRHPSSIRRRFLSFAFIAPLLPPQLIRRGYALIIPWLKRKKLLSGNSESLFYSMLAQFSPELMRKMPKLIQNWKGCNPNIPIAHIHGKGDWLIRPNQATVLIDTQNHLLTLSHPTLVREFLKAETGY